MSKYLVDYKETIIRCDEITAALFDELGFKLKILPVDYGKFSDTTHSVIILNPNIKHNYSFGSKGCMSIEEIKLDVINTVCRIYKNRRTF